MNGMNANQEAGTVGASNPEPSLQHSMLFVQALKGAPASVLLALAITGRFMSKQELQLWTRCGQVQVKLALRQLQLLGWVRARTSRGPWAVADGLKVSIPSFFAQASDLKALNDNDDSLNSMEEETSSSSDRRDHLRRVLEQQGIEEPTASELADLPYVTEQYILAHVHAARGKGLTLGAAIERMRLGGSAPAIPTPMSRQARTEEQVRRFIEGD
jgi:hypothetical protein